MSQNIQSLQLSQILKPSPSSSSPAQTIPTNQTPPIFKTNYKISRRELAICIVPSLLSLQNPFYISKAHAEEEPLIPDKAEAQEENSSTKSCTDSTATKRAFLDISINGEPAGRIIIGLHGSDVPEGSARFSSLLTGVAGISYRRKEFVKIMPNYVQHGGVRSFGVDAELAKKTGSNLAVENLITEWERLNEKCPGTKNVAGSVSIVVRDPSKPPPKLKLVARKGKLEIDEEEVGTDPNGTEFVISSKDSPELDSSSLVVGRVLDGMDVVEKIAKVKTVQENTSSPYFR
ncbi:Cyclophilin-like peptidyl-prolyl cis-trans isomerase domain [Macleaya cordata]|uniref:Cyclophilin-like peptidyl-prolyl cis-trans isomerase domain n=1 Tax=Macleaya cordata TaxID=56857 RepID=A0A200Q3M7_MACCD|nr:Cyclophilin-like peptidyl-prolyl cis-trans isomerase domain [Macleaya cordata]